MILTTTKYSVKTHGEKKTNCAEQIPLYFDWRASLHRGHAGSFTERGPQLESALYHFGERLKAKAAATHWPYLSNNSIGCWMRKAVIQMKHRFSVSHSTVTAVPSSHNVYMYDGTQTIKYQQCTLLLYLVASLVFHESSTFLPLNVNVFSGKVQHWRYRKLIIHLLNCDCIEL